MNAHPPPYAALSHRQEAFAEAYIRAICAVAGCGVDRIILDNDKVDFTVSCRFRGSVKTKPKLDIQSKCEISGLASADPISYVLDLETYDNLRDPRVANPKILVLLVSPKSNDEWISQSEAELALRHCAYWVSLAGAPEVQNSTAKTVYIPRSNVFSPLSLQNILEKIGNGEDL